LESVTLKESPLPTSGKNTVPVTIEIEQPVAAVTAALLIPTCTALHLAVVAPHPAGGRVVVVTGARVVVVV
jgi:hypothetical protein